MSNYEQLLSRAPSWRDELEAKLMAHGGDDLVAPYSQVALGFPSNQPNPRSFETPLIDSQQLQDWASTRGWHAQLTQDMEASDGYPPVHFTKSARA